MEQRCVIASVTLRRVTPIVTASCLWSHEAEDGSDKTVTCSGNKVSGSSRALRDFPGTVLVACAVGPRSVFVGSELLLTCGRWRTRKVSRAVSVSTDVPCRAQVFNKSLLSKFFWAMDAPPDFHF